MVAPETSTANTHCFSPPSSMNAYHTNPERPADTAINIQRGRSSSRPSVGGPRSPSMSPMSASSESEMDYAERVALNNNMDVVENDNSTSTANITGTDMPSDPSVSSHVASNLTHDNNKANTLTQHEAYIPSAQLTPPTVIPYSSNIPADPSLWDGNFMATSLFGTNEVLQEDIQNITCSLSRMAAFLKQRNLEDNKGNSFPQLAPFGNAAWLFISAVFESGWDQLNTDDNSPLRDNILTHFIRNRPPPPF